VAVLTSSIRSEARHLHLPDAFACTLIAMIGVALSADLLTGLALGVCVGMLVSPLLRAWLTWREWVDASHEADLMGDVLRRMDADDERSRVDLEHAPRAEPKGLRA
jgi:hypothetical protein